MTKEEYDNQHEGLLVALDKAKLAIDKIFVLANNPYKVGDIVQSHCDTIRIERVSVGLRLEAKYPECVYSGPMVKKNGDPIKSGRGSSIYQSNIIKDKKKIKLKP